MCKKSAGTSHSNLRGFKNLAGLFSQFNLLILAYLPTQKGKKTMYIISKFHDYYDCLMKQGLDKTLIYHRNEETIAPLPHNLGIYHYYQDFIKKTVNGYFYLPRLSATGYAHTYVTINTGLLGFCGKQYLVMICQYQEITLASCIYSRWLDKLKHAKLDSYKKNIYQFLEQHLAEKSKSYSYTNYHGGLAINEKNMAATFNNQHAIKLHDELFIE
jgi:hypothetical protein